MKRIFLTSLIAIPVLVLSGCSSFQYNEKKAPCPPTASTSENPCNPLPINVAEIIDIEEANA